MGLKSSLFIAVSPDWTHELWLSVLKLEDADFDPSRVRRGRSSFTYFFPTCMVSISWRHATQTSRHKDYSRWADWRAIPCILRFLSGALAFKWKEQWAQKNSHKFWQCPQNQRLNPTHRRWIEELEEDLELHSPSPPGPSRLSSRARWKGTAGISAEPPLCGPEDNKQESTS